MGIEIISSIRTALSLAEQRLIYIFRKEVVSMATAIIGTLAGLFLIFCSLKNYDWFFESRKLRHFTRLLGRKGARIVYAIIGFIFILTVILTY